MSEYATQLSTVLVDELFGGLPSRVYKALAFHGRLPLSTLVHRTQLSPTEVRHGLSILIQQHLVLWYDPQNTGQAFYEADIPTAYALSRSGKYTRLVKDRFGNIAGDIVSNVTVLGHVRVGDLTRTYFPPPHERGPLQEIIPGDCPLQAGGVESTKLNGTAQDDGHSADSLHTSLSDLIQAGLLCLVHEFQFRTVADNVTEAKNAVPSADELPGSQKVQRAMHESLIAKKLDEWKSESAVPALKVAQPRKSTKRAFEGGSEQPSGKRKKLMDKTPTEIMSAGRNAHSTESGWLDVCQLVQTIAETKTDQMQRNLIVRVDHEKFAILIRNQQLVDLVKDSIGPVTAKVYDGLLHNAGQQLGNCKGELDCTLDDDDGEQNDFRTLPQVSADDLDYLLHDSPDLTGALGYADPSKINLYRLDHPKKVKRRRRSDQSNPDDEAAVDGFASSDGSDGGSSDDSKSDISGVDRDSDFSKGDDDYAKDRKHETPDTTPYTSPKINESESPLHALRQHLILLAEHPHKFLVPVGPSFTAPGSWVVPYPLLSRTLLENALFKITTTRFGPLAGRLFRILSSTQTAQASPPKLDEKTLVILSLIPQKPMRTLLHSMHQAGHIELQELPKDGNQRRPGTTSFFWFFDAERMRKRVLEETYKSMGNLIRRAKVEKEAVKGVVEKSERTDVAGREEELLGEEELGALTEWRAREERIWGQVGRLDEIVAVLRDF
ncbi:MAG: hypothetical protein Q9184_001640 [Pyrenodesmia sp. 2 TL-2023]